MKDERTKTSIEVGGLDAFRKGTTLGTLICSCISAIIIAVKPRECSTNPNLLNGVIITMSVQISVFFLFLLHYIHCGCCLRKVGGWLGIFYFILTGLMTWTQIIFMEGSNCMREAVVLYWWLAINIFLFYGLIAYGLSLWGAYLCWAQQEEEELTQEALEHKFKKMQAQGQMVDHEQPHSSALVVVRK